MTCLACYIKLLKVLIPAMITNMIDIHLRIEKKVSLQSSLQRNKQAFFRTSSDKLISFVLTSLVSFCYALSVNVKISKSLRGFCLELFNIQLEINADKFGKRVLKLINNS